MVPRQSSETNRPVRPRGWLRMVGTSMGLSAGRAGSPQNNPQHRPTRRHAPVWRTTADPAVSMSSPFTAGWLGGHDGLTRTVRTLVTAGRDRRRARFLDRPDAPQCVRNGRLVSRRGRRALQRSGAFARGRAAVRHRCRAQLRRRGGDAACRSRARRWHRRGRDHDAQRHPLPVCRSRARRRPRRGLRQAGHSHPRAGARPGLANARAGSHLRHRARLLGLPDDPPRPAIGARGRDRRGPAGAGGIHPERSGDAGRRRRAVRAAALGARHPNAAARHWC